MPNRYEPVEIKPPQGGALISNLSLDTAGIFHYEKKLNFRRYIDRELRREGHDYFFANTDVPLGNQPFPYGTGTDIAPGGNWGVDPDIVTVHKGWSYIYTSGANELEATNGEDGPVLVDGELFQALTDEVIVVSAEADGDPRTYTLIEFEPINLIHETRRPNGQRGAATVLSGMGTHRYQAG